MIKTFDVKCGTVLVLPNGKKMLFATEEEAVEYIRSMEEDSDE